MKRKNIIALAVALIAMLLLVSACGTSTASSEPSEKHIYDNAQVKDVMNGSRTEKIGEYSIVEIDSSEVTEEALTDWYFNYVAKNDFNFSMILYTDKERPTGVYAIDGFIEKDLYFEQTKYGDYEVGESVNTTVYIPLEDGTLMVQENQE